MHLSVVRRFTQAVFCPPPMVTVEQGVPPGHSKMFHSLHLPHSTSSGRWEFVAKMRATKERRLKWSQKFEAEGTGRGRHKSICFLHLQGTLVS